MCIRDRTTSRWFFSVLAPGGRSSADDAKFPQQRLCDGALPGAVTGSPSAAAFCRSSIPETSFRHPLTRGHLPRSTLESRVSSLPSRPRRTPASPALGHGALASCACRGGFAASSLSAGGSERSSAATPTTSRRALRFLAFNAPSDRPSLTFVASGSRRTRRCCRRAHVACPASLGHVTSGPQLAATSALRLRPRRPWSQAATALRPWTRLIALQPSPVTSRPPSEASKILPSTRPFTRRRSSWSATTAISCPWPSCLPLSQLLRRSPPPTRRIRRARSRLLR